MKERIRLELKDIIMNNVFFDENTRKIEETTHLLNDLSMDSIKLLEMISEVEEKYDIMFDDDELEIDKIGVFGNLCRYVEEKHQ